MIPLHITQIIVSLTLIGLIVLQAKGTSLGRSFGATNYHAKRGMEKTVFYATIAAATLFITLAIIIAF